MFHLTECPRDAMQGIHAFIPTDLKIRYLNALLAVGFDVLDFGSFVSPKAIPQMADTPEVLAGLHPGNGGTRLLAIVANDRGAEAACAHPQIALLGYPFSISETFQLRNTNKTIAESRLLVRDMQARCSEAGKTLLVYLSMGFGNPYGDPWSPDLAAREVEALAKLGLTHLALADTVGTASPAAVEALFSALVPRFPEVSLGAHLHAAPADRLAKLQAAYDGGCTRFDAALNGYGGCPMAQDALVGNMATETLLAFLEARNLLPPLSPAALAQAQAIATEVFAHADALPGAPPR